MKKIITIILMLTLIVGNTVFASSNNGIGVKGNIGGITITFNEESDKANFDIGLSVNNKIMADGLSVDNFIFSEADIDIKEEGEFEIDDAINLEIHKVSKKEEFTIKGPYNPSPDLCMYSLSSINSEPFQFATKVKFQFTVANIGESDSGNYKVSMKINDSILAKFSLASIPMNSGRRYTITLSENVLIPNGDNIISFTADEENLVEELNETNNIVAKSFGWSGGIPNLTGLDLISNGPYKQNTDIDYKYTVRNTGYDSVSPFALGIYVNGNLIGSKTYSKLDSLRSTILGFTLNIPSEGSYLIEGRLDHLNNISEADETDNNKTLETMVLSATTKLDWPTESRRITDLFGTPREHSAGKHLGIDIGAVTPNLAGDRVSSVESGLVSFSGKKVMLM